MSLETRKTNFIKKTKYSILKILKSNPNKSLNYKQLSKILNITEEKKYIIDCLYQLSKNKKIIEVKKGKFKVKQNSNYYTGIFYGSARGLGYVKFDESNEDVKIPINKTKNALNGDEVEFYINNRKRNGKSTGEIIEVIKRFKLEYVGVINLNKNFAFVIPDDSKIHVDIYVPEGCIKQAKNGDKVLVKIKDWPKNADCPVGKVIKVLGKPGNHKTELNSILAEYNLSLKFPKEIENFANKLKNNIEEEEVEKRRDFREVITFTIDPSDAKDFDDALSFKFLKNGNYEIGIHIADVSYYVKENTILDKEAFKRGTSVYLVDQVIPMLPEVLCNKICSLRPNEEKYTFSAVFELNENGKIVNEWYGKSIILSNYRFTYEEAQYIIEKNVKIIPKNIALQNSEIKISNEIKESLIKLDFLAKKIRKNRMLYGAITFDKIEVKFKLDKENEPKEIIFKESKDSNKLIEEFMLLANKKVAQFLAKKRPKISSIYRIHDKPDLSKLKEIEQIAKKLGYKLNISNTKNLSNELNRLLEKVKGEKEHNLFDTLIIRSMSKAEYSTNNIGHYGLSFKHYTHFTSPIRRYPDIIIHRLLNNILDDKKIENQLDLDGKCKYLTEKEKISTKAERSSIKYMQVKYMEKYKNRVYRGVISGVKEWGMYVEILDNQCEGLIRNKDIKGDYYIFDSANYCLVGEKTKKKFQLGDLVSVRIKSADPEKRQLNLTLNKF